MQQILQSLVDDPMDAGAGVRLPVPPGAAWSDSGDLSAGSATTSSAASSAFVEPAAAVGAERMQSANSLAGSDEAAAAEEYEEALQEELKGHGVQVATGAEAPAEVDIEAVRDLLRSVEAEHGAGSGAARALLAAKGVRLPHNVDAS